MPDVFPGPGGAGRRAARDVVPTLEVVPGLRGALQFHHLDVPGLPEYGLSWRKKSTGAGRESLSAKHRQIAEPAADPREEHLQALFAAIATLSPLNKAIVLLYLDEVSYEEIASITGLTKSNVSVRLVRIKKELEVQLKKHANSPYDVNA